MNEREQRGLLIAATCQISRKGSAWLVPSQSDRGKKYIVVPDPEEPTCSCPDHETRNCRCKHLYAVEFVMKREQNKDGSVTDTKTLVVSEKRTSYPQRWSEYNRAQTQEKEIFLKLLHNLCQTIPEPPQTMGRPRLPLRDSIFAACFKVYSTFSGRRFMSDLREAHEDGQISRCPCYNSIFNVLEAPETFEILKQLVAVSAAPLKAVETNFACDSSGFSGCRYDRWIEEKYGSPMKKSLRAWVKCHVMCGVKTNVITAVEIHDQNANDGVQLRPLLDKTAQQFTVKEVSADLAYSTHANLEAVDSLGAIPFIPFKKNATDTTGGLWALMFHFFSLNRSEFLSRYHLRSNVESTFSMIKRKFGDSVRSKCDIAMKNEVLAKIVCHNICCVIHETFESGVDPTFMNDGAGSISAAGALPA